MPPAAARVVLHSLAHKAALARSQGGHVETAPHRRTGQTETRQRCERERTPPRTAPAPATARGRVRPPPAKGGGGVLSSSGICSWLTSS